MPQWAWINAKAASLQTAPMSPKWLAMRSSSAITPRSTVARGGVPTPSAASTARANAKPSATVEIPGRPRDDARRLGEVDIGQKAVDALVHVAEPLLEPRHRLAIRREAEMAGLDDAGMHGADRNLVQAVTVHGQETVVDRIAPRRRRARAERRVQFPLAVIEPGAPVGGVRRPVAV